MLHVVDLIFFLFFCSFLFSCVFLCIFFCFLRSLFFFPALLLDCLSFFFSRLAPPFSRCVGLISERLPASSGTTKLRFCRILRSLGLHAVFSRPHSGAVLFSTKTCMFLLPLAGCIAATHEQTSRTHVRSLSDNIMFFATLCVVFLQARFYS